MTKQKSDSTVQGTGEIIEASVVSPEVEVIDLVTAPEVEGDVIEEVSKLPEFKEVEIEVIKDDKSGLKEGDKLSVSGNIAEALISKGIAKLV